MEPAQNFIGKIEGVRKTADRNMREDTSGYARFAPGADDYPPIEKLADRNHTTTNNHQSAPTEPNGVGPDNQSPSTCDRLLRCVNRMSRRQLVLIIVFIALFLDNMLLTSVVPIIPTFLYGIEHPNGTSSVVCSAKLTSSRTGVCRAIRMTTTRAMTTDSMVTMDPFPISDDDKDNDDDDDDDDEDSANQRRLEIADENVEVGIMFASKSIMQMMINPIIGPLTNRIGYSIPMFTGFLVMFLSTLIFAFGTTYKVLFAARAIQGIGSACSSVAGLGMLATYYTDDEERGRAMSRVLGGLAIGVLVGPVFGGFMYEMVGKAVPFLLLAFLALFDGSLQMLVLKPGVRPETQQGAPLRQLLSDPYILIAAGSITFGNMGIAMLEPSLPLWMWVEMDAQEWQQGIAFLPCSVSYLIGTNLFGSIAHKIGRWRSGGIGMLVISIALFFIPFAKSIVHLLIPNFCLGFAIGMVDSSMMPLMGYLVDLRHVSVYGSVYAIADIAFCVGFAVGPLLAGAIVKAIGFKWMLWCISACCFLYSPLHYFLRNPPARNDDVGLIMSAQCPADYSNANNGKLGEAEAYGQEAAVNGHPYAAEGRYEVPPDAYSMQLPPAMPSNNPFMPTAQTPQIILAHQTTDYMHSDYYP